LTYAEEAGGLAESRAAAPSWKLLIVDDEEGVHVVTKMSLTDFLLDGRPLEFLSAYSGREAVELVQRHPDVALILMDVVMETDSAGLDTVEEIRNRLGNRIVRIVLRTGQAGVAPEREVVDRYDIDDYKEKTEVTARRLYTMVRTQIMSYDALLAAQKRIEYLERRLDDFTTK
jgi:CheY-like chemotaxis protein